MLALRGGITRIGLFNTLTKHWASLRTASEVQSLCALVQVGKDGDVCKIRSSRGIPWWYSGYS